MEKKVKENSRYKKATERLLGANRAKCNKQAYYILFEKPDLKNQVESP